jgi:hypothetical protein
MKKISAQEGGRETLLSYTGNASDISISCLLELAEYKLGQQPVALNTRKKVFRILVEALQNLYHHVDELVPSQQESAIKFTLEKDHSEYQVNTTNTIKSTKIMALKQGIDKFNAMTMSELKQYYRNRLSKGHFINDGTGAGLGFADIIRRSGEKISYSFKPVNKDYSYFSLQVKVLA